MPRGTQVPTSSSFVFAYVAITPYGSAFQRDLANDWIVNSTVVDPTTPATPEGMTGLG